MSRQERNNLYMSRPVVVASRGNRLDLIASGCLILAAIVAGMIFGGFDFAGWALWATQEARGLGLPI